MLAEHIEAEEGIELTLIIKWPPNPNPEIAGPWIDRLPYDRAGPNTIIIDEAQLTYWDTGLWNDFLKYITKESQDRVILFASYGSPTFRVSAEGTSMILPKFNRIGLRPEDHKDGIAPAGLLLTREEFTEMVGRVNQAGILADDFLDYVFRVTAGHTGAVVDLLRAVLAHDVSLRVQLQHSLIIVSSHIVILRTKSTSTHWKCLRPNFLSRISTPVSRI